MLLDERKIQVTVETDGLYGPYPTEVEIGVIGDVVEDVLATINLQAFVSERVWTTLHEKGFTREMVGKVTVTES